MTAKKATVKVDKRVERLQKALDRYTRVEQVLIAAGVLRADDLKRAWDLVDQARGTSDE